MTATVEPTALLGTWRLERRIVDRAVGAAAATNPSQRFGRVTGTLTLATTATVDGPAVSWFEQGTFTWCGRSFAVSRRLLIRRADHDGSAGGGPAWTVCFEDGQVFHAWQPGARVVHPCRADTYVGVVDVDASRTELRVLWDVAGPAKDRRLFTRCTRL